MRQHPLKIISKNDVIVSKKSITKDDLNTLILKIKASLKHPEEIIFDVYTSNSFFLNEKEFKRFVSFLPSPPPEYSILNTHPEISKQWHFNKNSPLKPENFTHGSHKKVWWKCSKGDDHEWETTINNRSNVRGCPYCAGKKISKSNNFLSHNPKVASEWHLSKNGNLKPENFTYGSKTKVWWRCHKVEGHEWEATINNRGNGSGCPYCSQRDKNKKKKPSMAQLKLL